MGTIVSLHAHPDDESIATGGTLARAADAGHRVVLVFATRGELGEPVPGVLAEGEQLTLRRTAEVYESARVLGAGRVEFLGYTDSGMIGEATNDVPWCFWQADVEQAARRLATILTEESPDVLTIYDDNGGYGHPDHIQVHRVGKRAAELAGVPVVAQGTMNRDLMGRAMALAKELGVDVPGGAADEPGQDAEEAGPPEVDRSTFGKPEAELTHVVDTTTVLDRKRASMLAHGSQIGPDHFMASMPPEAFAYIFGTEWFIVEPPLGPDAPALFAELFQPAAELAGR
ncbi:PIG-L family deacetylase [Aquihabitans sp. G128]|uniref:PIG-L family deacetylase n=1 Tax=Aquihabitans sp. G128 TaxID=2849779 RepID=UPI001C23542B|nr:PIG-L family deacetylase [Aquihabitans sp. G128]QXC62672.1 PIG-L family deacetylase [Aquihabitans sp. G128]